MPELYYPGQPVEVDVFVCTEPSALERKADEGATTIRVYDASRWSNADVLKIGDGDPQLSRSQIVAIQSIAGNVVTLASVLLYTFPVDTPVYHLVDATLAMTVTKPDGSSSAVTLNSVSTGRYRGTYTPSLGESHSLEATASGAAVGAGQGRIWVETEGA